MENNNNNHNLIVPNPQDSLWMMNLRTGETMDSGSYPERPGEPDCSYYMRTGLCRFGATCRFNHPPNRKLVYSTFFMHVRMSICTYMLFSYYLKTGTCKFGATCKFHHPKDQAGIAGRVALNILGYPLRPNEPECTYYLRTGQCKFGNTCKFHHPQPSNMMLSLRGSPVYPTVHSPTTPGQQSYAGGTYIPSPRWQGPSSYAPLILPQGVVSVPGWSAYSGQMGSISTSDSPQQAMRNGQTYGTSRQGELAGSQGAYSQFRSGTVPVGFYTLQRENIFPERPGQPECQFYMKTGDCKFGAVCRFHHPQERLVPAPNCVLSPIGLPLRPGEPLCVFYSRYGICKFGPSCKFDHPMEIFSHNISASPSADAPSRHLLGSSSGTAALNLSSEGLVESSSAKPRRLSLSETRQIPSGDDDIDDDG
ncbi:Zinc finger CCCH domain-containing protein ZFN-like [Glycine soja]